jgi:translation elongation factor P/translation initiation factor 5A
MDLGTFEVTESPIPTEPELQGKLGAGAEVEVWVVLGKSKIMRVKGTS